MKGIQFTSEEKQLLIEALLFASAADVCAEWTAQQTMSLRGLAKKLNDEGIRLSNIYLFGCESYDVSAEAAQVAKEFPNLPRVSEITD